MLKIINRSSLYNIDRSSQSKFEEYNKSSLKIIIIIIINNNNKIINNNNKINK